MAEEYRRMIKAQEIGDRYALYCGDSAEVLKMLPGGGGSLHHLLPAVSKFVHVQQQRP